MRSRVARSGCIGDEARTVELWPVIKEWGAVLFPDQPGPVAVRSHYDMIFELVRDTRELALGSVARYEQIVKRSPFMKQPALSLVHGVPDC